MQFNGHNQMTLHANVAKYFFCRKIIENILKGVT